MSANRLDRSRSAYLRSAAGQPIHWYPWGPEAFAAAREADRPVLLDIGAVWCHWCHVMDHESYEDPGLAAYLNEHFVCIKVDRDERPDVDARYQRAVQAITGQGGWPLTGFLTPAGEVYFGGTYFPPDDRWGRPGFRTVLEQVLGYWRERRDQAVERAGALREALAARQAPTGAGGEVGPAVLLAAERRILAAFDPAFGGFGGQPKFPHPTALRYLMNRWSDQRSAEVRHAVLDTLQAMARGGLRDHLGGGFHRYSVDRRWIIPHFEKMSYDNSELLRAYARGAALFDDPQLGEAARGILRWVREVLALPGGGFGTSQDADVGPEDDGSYFTWTRREIEDALDPDDRALALRHYGVDTLGRMPDDPERNVLFAAVGAEELAGEQGLGVGEVEARLAAIRERMLAVRKTRPAPMVDATPYASWNAMMASAGLRAAAVLDDAWAAEHALATLRRLRGEASAEGVPHAAGTPTFLLEDQVFTADAALDAFETTGDPEWLAWAAELMERVWREYREPGSGGLRDRPPGAAGAEGLLATPLVGLEDAPVPSPNGIAGVVFARLAAHTGADHWGERHRAVVEAFAGDAPAAGLHAGAWLLAADWLVRGPTTVVITGPADDPRASALHRAALAAPLPRRVVRRVGPGDPAVGLPSPLAALAPGAGEARGFVCLGDRCLAPAQDPGEWRTRLAEAAGS